jgi:EpsD family peptidyl-prolyl cis-trans isomerase
MTVRNQRKLIMRLTNKFLFLLLIGSSVVLTSCGKKEEAAAKKSDTQVVAKVNGDEITIHQVNFQLQRMGQMNEAQSKLAAKQVLARLVEMQLLKQKAIETKLDRDPAVLQAMESSKDQMLAQAYLEKLMISAPKASTSEIDTFYKAHPELFESRRVFRLQELVVSIDKDKFAETEASLKGIKGINEIATWLKDKNLPFTINSNVKAAEQLPLELLKKLQVLKDGEVLIVSTANALNVVHIAASQVVPITRVKATPVIEQYFFNQNKTSLAKKEMIALNEKAKIEFVGVFKDMKKSELTQPDAIQPAPEQAKVETDSPSSTASKKTDKQNANAASIEKGLSGL